MLLHINCIVLIFQVEANCKYNSQIEMKKRRHGNSKLGHAISILKSEKRHAKDENTVSSTNSVDIGVACDGGLRQVDSAGT